MDNKKISDLLILAMEIIRNEYPENQWEDYGYSRFEGALEELEYGNKQ